MPQKRLYLRPEFWIGIIVLLGGIAHLLERSGISLTAMLENYWPVLFIITGIFQVSSTRYRDAGATVFLILTGVILLLFKNGFLSRETLEQHWPQSFLKLLDNLLNFVISAINLLGGQIEIISNLLNITSGVLK